MSERVTVKVERGTVTLPCIALRGLVVFPNNVIHFEVGREKSINAVEAAMEENLPIFLVAQKEMDREDPTGADLYTYGVVAEVKQVLRMSDDLVKVLVEGKYRAKLLHLTDDGKLLRTVVRQAPVRGLKIQHKVETDALIRKIKDGFDKYLTFNSKLSKNVIFNIMTSEDPQYLSEYMPANLLLKYQDKQAVLNENTLMGSLQKLLEVLERECLVLAMEQEIEDRVNEQMDRNQREYYLREQLHAITNELGEGEDVLAEAEEYRKAIEALPLPEEGKEKLLKETNRLSRMQSNSPEAAVARNYLDVCLELPWGKKTQDVLDIARAREVLDRDHYGMTKVKERILEILAVRKLNPDIRGQIICLVGPPGVGKTSIAKSIAQCMGRSYARMSLGGVRDEAEIRGHRRTYIGAMPGKIISAISTAKTCNPLILLDEIDKLGSDGKGDPGAALLEALDPEQNKTFKDHYLDMPFDLSDVLFITTANALESIPGPLRDRMDVIELSSYTRNEKFQIAKRHLLPKQLKNNGVEKTVTLNAGAIYGLIDGYTNEAGVRNLEREIGKVLRRCAVSVAAGETKLYKVTASNLEKILGPKKNKPDFISRKDSVGIANGLAWTSVGGTMLPIEVVAVPQGEGKIQITGSLGDVMKESAQLAITYARVHAPEYGLDPNSIKKMDLHIHAPEGAVPKDGPSAGVTLTTALMSCLTGWPVRCDVAMTGEITLHGNVLPIGGLKEKSMAAYREGMKMVLIPKGNESDLYEVDDEVKKAIQFVPVSDLEQVLKAALEPPVKTEKNKNAQNFMSSPAPESPAATVM